MADKLHDFCEGTDIPAASAADCLKSSCASAGQFAAAVAALRQGEPAVFPTDTVYGLGVSVAHAATPQILYEIKGRDEGKPVAWLVDGPAALDLYGQDVPQVAYGLAERFWPGALTLIVPASDAVPAAYLPAAGVRTVALRMPAGQTALDLISAVGCPLATTSANVSGRAAVSVYSHIESELLNQVNAAVEADADARGAGVASTIVDCSVCPPAVVRQGGVDVSAWL